MTMGEQMRAMSGALGWAVGVLEYHAARGAGMEPDAVERLLGELRARAARAGIEDLGPVLERAPAGRRAP